MKLALLLHLYQPPTQTEHALKSVVTQCYHPLFKLIKNKPDIKLTINIPLSLLELLDRNGYNELLSLIKDLSDNEKIEFTGTGAYHPLLTKLDKDYSFRHIVLQEFGLGYYFGQRRGFEGESSILVKDIRGFFPPEMAVSTELIEQLDSLNYEWVAVDSSVLSNNLNVSTISDKDPVYKLDGYNTRLVVRDTSLSNILSFKRDSEVLDVVDYLIKKSGDSNFVLAAMDGEVFGHHNRDGIYVLETLLDSVKRLSMDVTTISDVLNDVIPNKIESITESTWSAASSGDYNPYWLWDASNNELHSKMWELHNLVSKTFAGKTMVKIESGYENIPVWIDNELNKLPSTKARQFLQTELMVLKSQHSDKFWWLSKETIADKYLYSEVMVRNALELYTLISKQPLMNDLPQRTQELISEIYAILEK